jgi:hypothetical protein
MPICQQPPAANRLHEKCPVLDATRILGHAKTVLGTLPVVGLPIGHNSPSIPLRNVEGPAWFPIRQGNLPVVDYLPEVPFKVFSE